MINDNGYSKDFDFVFNWRMIIIHLYGAARDMLLHLYIMSWLT